MLGSISCGKSSSIFNTKSFTPCCRIAGIRARNFNKPKQFCNDSIEHLSFGYQIQRQRAPSIPAQANQVALLDIIASLLSNQILRELKLTTLLKTLFFVVIVVVIVAIVVVTIEGLRWLSCPTIPKYSFTSVTIAEYFVRENGRKLLSAVASLAVSSAPTLPSNATSSSSPTTSVPQI